MSISTTWALKMETVETLADDSLSPTAAQTQITHKNFDEGATLTGVSTPAVSKIAAAVVALVAGAKTLDLTALTGTNGAAVTMNGLKIVLFRIKNLGASVMTFTEGAANGYELAGTGWTVTLAQNQVFQFYGDSAAPTVGGTTKNIDVTGTGTETFELTVIGG